MTTLFLDIESGNDASDGLTFNNRVKTLSRVNTLASVLKLAGDTIDVRMKASRPVNSLGINGVFVNGHYQVGLSSPVTKLITNCETAWSVVTNVTASTTSDRMAGDLSCAISIGSSFTTGKASYLTLSPSIDLSGYQQLSFWCKYTHSPSSWISIKLCSDTLGATPVNTFQIPVAHSPNAWQRFVIDLGSAMGNNIQSIALYVDTDIGTATVQLNNINACKANGTGELTLLTVVGNNNAYGAGGNDTQPWYAVQSIFDTYLTLAANIPGQLLIGGYGHYYGQSETASIFSQPLSIFSSSTTVNDCILEVPVDSITGGWSRTDMSSQDGQTWLGAPGQMANLSYKIFSANTTINKINFAMTVATMIVVGYNAIIGTLCFVCSNGITLIGNNHTVEKIIGVGSSPITIAGHNVTLSDVYIAGHSINAINASISISGVGCKIINSSYILGNITVTNAKIKINNEWYGIASPNQIADHVRRRNQSAVESSTDGDTINLASEYGVIQQCQEFGMNGTTLNIYKTDGTTLLGTRLLTKISDNPIRGVS